MSIRVLSLSSVSSLAFNIALIGSFTALFPAVGFAACISGVSSNTTVSTSNTNCSVAWTGGNLTLTNTGSITNPSGSALYLSGGSSVGTLSNSGMITVGSGSAISNNGSTIDAITNAGTISGVFAIENYNNATINTLTNSGTISSISSGTAIAVASGSTIGSISNTGTITSDFLGIGIYGFSGGGTVNSIYNGVGANIIGRSDAALVSGGTLGTVTNYGSMLGYDGIRIDGGTVDLIENYGDIGFGYSEGSSNTGISIYGSSTTADQIINHETGQIYGGSSGMSLSANITSITNAGRIVGGDFGIDAYGLSKTIGSIVNSSTGEILQTSTSGSAFYAALYNRGTITSLTNDGLIQGAINAIYSTGTITNAIENNGTIDGNIYATQSLDFTGGSSETYGVIENGTITATNLTFESTAFQTLASDINVGSGAGTFTNDGTLRLNTAQSVTGNFLQSSGGTLEIGVDDEDNYGNLTVTGNTVMLNSHVFVTSVGEGELVEGSSYIIVKTAGTANYTGITATASGFTASLSTNFDGFFNNLIVTLGAASGGGDEDDGDGGGDDEDGSDYERIGSQIDRGNTKTTGRVLDQLYQVGDTSFDELFAALDALGAVSEAREGAAIRRLAPTQLTPQLLTTGLSASQAGQMIGQHQADLVDGLRTGGRSFGQSSGSGYQKGVFWGEMVGGISHKDDTTDVGGYDNKYYGITAGADAHVSNDLVVGGALSWVKNNADGNGNLEGLTTKTDSVQVTAYGTKRMGSVYINAALGAGINMFDQTRHVDALNAVASADYNGMQYMGKLDAGWDLRATRDLVLTPVAGVSAIHTANDNYEESGAGSANLRVKEQTTNNFTTNVGIKATTTMMTGWGELTPELKVSWIHDLENGPILTKALMGGQMFSTEAPRADKNGAEISLGLTLKRSDELTLRAQYDADLRADYYSHTGLVKAFYSF